MNAFLMDTHAFIWYANGDTRMSQNAIDYIDSAERKLLSIASLWEMPIKVSLSKLIFHHPFNETVGKQIDINNYKILEIKQAHVFKVRELLFHHRDPFDRMIISQSIIEEVPILSSDARFDNYPIKRIW